MIGRMDNPFDCLDLSPTATAEEITQTLRDYMQGAGEDERRLLRSVWERFMTHPRERVVLALGAHPRTAARPVGLQPPARPGDDVVAQASSFALVDEDRVPLPSMHAGLSFQMPHASRNPIDVLLEDPVLGVNDDDS